MDYLKDLYRNRFSEVESRPRLVMWDAIYNNALKKYISNRDIVMDVGAGNCELLNIISCQKKIAVDLNPDTKRAANRDVEVLNVAIAKIPRRLDGKIDVVILSHVLEHLNTKDDVIALLNRVHILLRPGGRVMILQPNIDLVKEAYWDFIDHKVALNTKSLVELLGLTRFSIVKLYEKFLPYTSKSGLPISRLAIYFYLHLPEMIRPFAGQSLVIGVKK